MNPAEDNRSRLTLSLDNETKEWLSAVSKGRGITEMELIRQALLNIAKEHRPHEWTREQVWTAKEGGYSEAQLRELRGDDRVVVPVPQSLLAPAKVPSLSTSALIIPERKVQMGLLVKSVSFLWEELASQLSDDWALAYQMPPEKLEEFVAGAFQKDGFDEVILTQRTHDKGRDIIAMKRGVGSVKILGSVKRNGLGKNVRPDDVRALLGVLTGDFQSSKGMLITTTDFSRKIFQEIEPFLPTRLELVNGVRLRGWIDDLRRKG